MDNFNSAIDDVTSINQQLKMPGFAQLREAGVWKFPDGMFDVVWQILRQVVSVVMCRDNI